MSLEPNSLSIISLFTPFFFFFTICTFFFTQTFSLNFTKIFFISCYLFIFFLSFIIYFLILLYFIALFLSNPSHTFLYISCHFFYLLCFFSVYLDFDVIYFPMFLFLVIFFMQDLRMYLGNYVSIKIMRICTDTTFYLPHYTVTATKGEKWISDKLGLKTWHIIALKLNN